MKILLSWLQEFITLPVDVRQIADDLTMLGLAVDSVTTEQDETILELDITTNRPDCLSHYGVARELAALYRKALPEFGDPETKKPRARRKDSVVRISAPELCHRYSARIIRGVQVGPSPSWLARRLELVGIRSINNVADATNYVLMAYGHPMHAFDLDRLQGGRIIVRRAADGESLNTLDGVNRRLTADDLVIADARRPVALAGVMGGQDTEISSQTQNVLLESAWFDPTSVRRTSKRQGMHTEASHRFERGADIGATVAAANRCIELIRELAGGTVDPQVIDAYARPEARKFILLLRSELQRHLGLEPPPNDVQAILSGLGFSVVPAGKKGWKVTAPTHRVDVTRQIDLVEEVARHYGYDKFPLRLPGAESGQPARKAPHAAEATRLREMCQALGYDETISFALVSKSTEAYGESPAVALSNPISEEGAVLRTSLVPGLLSALQWNLNRGAETVRLFEVGKIYRDTGNGYNEPDRLAFIATGECVEPGLGRTPQPVSFFDIKGDLEQIAELFEIGAYDFAGDNLPAYYRAGHDARLIANGDTIARMGELNPDEAARWKFRQPVYLAEIFLDALYAKGLRSPRVQAISRFPAVQRDFSILLPEQKRFREIRSVIASIGIPELIAVAPVEIFRGAGIPQGQYSLLLRVTLQSPEATLTEAELTQFSSQIINALEKELGAQIRM